MRDSSSAGLVMDKASFVGVHEDATGQVGPLSPGAFGAELVAVDVGHDAAFQAAPIDDRVSKSHVRLRDVTSRRRGVPSGNLDPKRTLEN